MTMCIARAMISERAHAESFRNAEQIHAPIEINILAGIDHVESANPQCDGGAENQHSRIERAGDGDPCRGGRNSQTKSENDVRPRSESLRVRIKERKARATGESSSASRLNLHAATTSNAAAQMVKAHANGTESAPVTSARFFVRGFSRVVAHVRDAIDRHRERPRADHGDDDPRDLPPRGPRGTASVACTVRAASSAAVSANGSAKMECSNLIISSTVRMRLSSSVNFQPSFASAGFRAAFPSILLFLRQINLGQRAANILLDEIVDCLRRIIKRGNDGHHYSAGFLGAQHVLQMHAI